MFALSKPLGLPRGYDLIGDYRILRVTGMSYPPSAPRGAIHFIAQEGGFRCVSVDDIAEVVGNIGAIEARQSNREKKIVDREIKRATRKSQRLARRKRLSSRDL